MLEIKYSRNITNLLSSKEQDAPKARVSEPVKAEAKTIPALKASDTPVAKSMPAKVQEPMYTKAASKILKVLSNGQFYC